MRTSPVPSLMLLAAALAAGCDSERPAIREAPPQLDQRVIGVQMSGGFQAGPVLSILEPRVVNPYADNVRARAEGERLYNWMNCTGCHGAKGGGGIGPPFADDDWIYGGDPANIYMSIFQGRPNGMPAYGGRLPNDEIWKVAAYVRELGNRAGENDTGQGATSPGAPGEGADGGGHGGGTGGGTNGPDGLDNG